MKLEATQRMRLRDVLVLSISAVEPDEEESLSELVTQLANDVRKPIIVLRDGMTLSSLSEAEMAEAGWVRKT